MGMLTEYSAANHAQDLREVMQKALASGDKTVIAFCRENVVPLFDQAVDRAQGEYKGDLTVRSQFDAVEPSLAGVQGPRIS